MASPEPEAPTVDKHGRLSIVAMGQMYPGKGQQMVQQALRAVVDKSAVQHLDLTDNELRKIPDLSAFTALHTLVLDQNNISTSSFKSGLPLLKNLENLWINANKIAVLDDAIKVVQTKCPKIKYLALLKNPCCPNPCCKDQKEAGKDFEDYSIYRFFVIHRLKTLKWLDYSPVSAKEKQQASSRGRFAVARPSSPKAGVGDAPDVIDASSKVSKNGMGKDVTDAVKDVEDGHAAKGGEHNARTYLGFNEYNYLGRESEGNRFIGNTEL